MLPIAFNICQIVHDVHGTRHKTK